MKTNHLSIILTCILSFTLASCSNSEPLTNEDSKKNINPINVVVSEFQMVDFGNASNGSDIYLSYTIEGEALMDVTSIKLLIAKNSTELDFDRTFSSDFLHTLSDKKTTDIQLPDNLKDIDGDLLENNIQYKAYLMIKGDDTTKVLSEPLIFTLADEIIVTTLSLEPSIAANEDLLVGTNGDVFVCGGWRSPSSLFKITDDRTTSVFSEVSSTPIDATFNPNGDLFVTTAENNALHKISSTGTALFHANTSGALAIDNQGVLYTLSYNSSTIYKVLPNKETEAFTTSTLINGPVGFEYDKERDVFYVGNWNDGKILSVDKSGKVTEIVDTDATIGRMSYLDDKLYITGNAQHQIYILSLTGEILTTIGSGKPGLEDGSKNKASFSNPNGIEITPNGDALYVASRAGGIRKIIL